MMSKHETHKILIEITVNDKIKIMRRTKISQSLVRDKHFPKNVMIHDPVEIDSF
jgi:hypothetical protein